MSWVPEGLGSHHVYQELGAHTSRWQVVAASLGHNGHVFTRNCVKMIYLGVDLSPGFLDSMADSSMETSQGVLSGRGGSMVEVNVLLSREALA